jgi:hypothetical protein
MERLTDLVKGELERFGAAGGLSDLIDAWPAAVGAAIAAKAWPARVGRDGTLHVSTADAVWAFELGQRSAEIATRLGVARVRFTPGMLAGHPSAPPAERPRPTSRELALAAEIVADVSSENLRETLGKTVSLSLARAASGRPV